MSGRSYLRVGGNRAGYAPVGTVVEYVLVAVVSVVAGILVYRFAAHAGRRLAPDESLEVPVGDPPPATPPRPTSGRTSEAPVPGAAVGADDPPPPPTRETSEGRVGEAFAYRSADLPPVHIPLRTRLLGLLGLIVLIVLAAAAIALALYQAGHLVRLQFERFLG
jgi:hypothetical protein